VRSWGAPGADRLDYRRPSRLSTQVPGLPWRCSPDGNGLIAALNSGLVHKKGFLRLSLWNLGSVRSASSSAFCSGVPNNWVSLRLPFGGSASFGAGAGDDTGGSAAGSGGGAGAAGGTAAAGPGPPSPLPLGSGGRPNSWRCK